MATLTPALLSEPAGAAPAPALLKLVLSPLRGADGKLRVQDLPVEPGQTIAESLPGEGPWWRLILNGRVVAPPEQATRRLAPGDELLALPQWGADFGASIWIPIVIGLVVSVASTALSYLLFPPAKPHIQQNVDEPTFGFEGIRTAIGPGNVVPVIYGRHRVGGQLLSASVDQVMTVRDGPTGIQRVEALSSPPTLTMLLALGEGPIQDILIPTIEINGQPIANFPSVQVFTRLGTADQTPIAEFGEIANTFADGRTIGANPGDPGIIYTTTAPVQAFVLNIAFQQGLYVLTQKGEKHDNLVTIAYRYRVSPAGAWSFPQHFDVSAARTSVVRFGIRKEGLALGTYDIEVSLTHANHTDELRAQWEPTLESVTEILHNTSAYPYTALLGLRTVATDAMQGALPNVTVEVLGRTVRYGSFTPPEYWTPNPAWCVMDLMTHPRYGLGYPDSVIDLNAFYAWAAYNEQLVAGEWRHELNYVLDREQRAQPLLLEMCGASRVLLLKSEGFWSPRITQNDTPVQLLSWTNVTNLTLTYTRDADRINVMEGRFTNQEQGYQADVLTWPAVENWPSEVRKASLDLRGITKPSRVLRALQFELNRRRFEVLSLEMDCAPDALVLQVHDVFRFSHPLPGWGTSGRVQAGTTADYVFLDTPVTCEAGKTYHLYVRYQEDTMEVRAVVHPGVGTFQTVQVTPPLGGVPEPEVSLWAFGESSPQDTAVRPFRVVRMTRNPDATVHIQAIAHNPSIYDEPEGIPLPIITSLFNPLGPAPPIVSLVLTEVTRVEPNGMSLRVVNISWDVAPLSSGYAPYGGATIFRRTVFVSGLGGSQQAGVGDLGTILDPTDSNYGFMPLTQVRGHILDFDDYTVTTGSTYVYRVVPISQRGVPNNNGAREGVIHVSGPTTPGYFPGTPQGLRLKGKAIGDTIFEGRNIELEWDPPTGVLFSETFFLQDYLVEVWIPGQVALLRRTIVPPKTAGQTIEWTYTLEQNTEDSLAAGYGGAQRQLMILVWGRTNTNRVSLTPASITVFNPPPDMGDMIPVVTALFEAALIHFDQFVEPRDFDHYEVHLDTVTPPIAIYENVAIAFTGVGSSFRKIAPVGLTPGLTYYVYILPYDTFGPGIPTQIASFVPVAITADALDTTPPAMPTGLALSTGSDVSADGTIIPWVQAQWTLNTEPDMARYETHWRLGTSLVPTVFTVAHPTTRVRHPNVPGNTEVHVRMLALDKFANASPFTEEVSLTSAADTLPPVPPTNLTAVGSIRAIALLWTPPPDPDYAHALVLASQTNDVATSTVVGTGYADFILEGLGPEAVWYFWLRSVDTSGNTSVDTHPLSPTAGVSGTAGQLDTTFISSLAVNKLLAGILNVFVQIGVGQNVYIDGPNSLLSVYDNQNPQRLRIALGKLGGLTDQYGLNIFNPAGQLMWNFTTGATPNGIEDAAITTSKIQAATIVASHLRTDTAVITVAAQIANAIVGTAHIQQAAITSVLIGDAQITNAKIGDEQVTSSKIGNANVLRAHIQDLAVDDAKIDNVTANKITTGTLQAVYRIGAGDFIVLDGVNHLITINDAANVVRVFLGRVGAEYGLQVYNAAAQLMWNFTSGATTQGITPYAVTESVSFTAFSNLDTTNAEMVVATLTLPTLQANDQVWLVGLATGEATQPDEHFELRLREDGLTGVLHHQSAGTGTGFQSVGVQGVYVAPSALSNKTFVLTFLNINASATVRITRRYFVALRRQR